MTTSIRSAGTTTTTGYTSAARSISPQYINQVSMLEVAVRCKYPAWCGHVVQRFRPINGMSSFSPHHGYC